MAVDKRRPEIVNILLKHGAIVNLLDNNGNTPAHYASDIPTLKILIAHNAPLDVVNKFDHTLLMTAAKEQRNNIFQYIRLYKIKHEERQNSVASARKPNSELSDRFGQYYRERIRNIQEMLRKENDQTTSSSDKDLPDLSCEMPPREELEVPTDYNFCKEPLGYKALSEATTVQPDDTTLETATTSENTRDGMSNLDETTPVFKLRQLKRLQWY